MAGDSELLAQAETIGRRLRHTHHRMRRMLDKDAHSSPLTRPQLQGKIPTR